MVRLAGLEPATFCLEDKCSIHLSYSRTSDLVKSKNILFGNSDLRLVIINPQVK